jgi:hypothetical protein
MFIKVVNDAQRRIQPLSKVRYPIAMAYAAHLVEAAVMFKEKGLQDCRTSSPQNELS